MIGFRSAGCPWALALLLLLAQSTIAAELNAPPPKAPPATENTIPTATLRLVQVVPRVPEINLYAVAQDDAGMPVALQPQGLSALVGDENVPAQLRQDDSGIAIVFLIDISKSLKHPVRHPKGLQSTSVSSHQIAFDLVRASVLAWISGLGPKDQAAIVTFGSKVATVQDFTAEKSKLTEAMKTLEPQDDNTLLYQGIVQGIDLAHRFDQNLPQRRAIVVLTDGLDDQEGGAGRQEVVDKLDVDPVPIYAIGTPSEARTRDQADRNDAALKEFASVAYRSGGDFRRAGDLDALDVGYSELHRIISATTHLVASCVMCKPDGSAVSIRLFYNRQGERFGSLPEKVTMLGADGKVHVEPPPSVQAPPPQQPAQPVVLPPQQPTATHTFNFDFAIKIFLEAPIKWSTLLGLVTASGAAAVALWLRRRKIENEKEKASVPAPRTDPESVYVAGGVLVISPVIIVRPGSQRDKRRLRLYPLGRNDLPPVEVLFEDSLTVGRAPDNLIVVNNDEQVSGHHCTLSPKGNRILIEDVGSRNGTRVNHVPIKGFLHAEEDAILGLGRTELRMKILPGETR